MCNINPMVATDSYKCSHWCQFPKGTRKMSYYLEARKGDVVFFGLQAIIKEYLRQPDFTQLKETIEFWNDHGFDCFNVDGWRKIIKLGYLPLRIHAVPEGMYIPKGRALVRIENTLDGFHWLVGWFETLLMHVWYPSTVCTRSFEIKRIIKKWLDKTGDVSGLMFKLHDFGFRGASSYQTAMFGGMAHLVNFMGTDTIAGIFGAKKYYNAKDVVGYSIPAAEHSTIISHGRENEKDAYENILDKFAKPGKLVAIVSDSYDLDNAVKHIFGEQLRDKIRESGATVIIRPDSGDPKTVTLRTLVNLEEKFGSTINEKGYKVLNNVRVINGDSISSPQVIDEILELIVENGYSVDNVAFGMGGGLLQTVNRDTYGFAMKSSAIQNEEGNWKGCSKSPKDSPWKKSKEGILDTGYFEGEDELKTINILNDSEKPFNSVMRKVYENGKLLIDYEFDEIREQANRFV